mmetsp:Transcript_3363/g.10236  ORF Transcript_3363/g.10236 Transcript_3363/m.10236 type:complete len:278 (+) Transcript_3363:74-907(+)
MVEQDMSRARDGMGDLARKSWTVEEEERLLKLLAEFEIHRGPGRGRKGKSKFAPMALKLNKDFHGRNRQRYPFRTWENLRVKSNNLRSKYETVKKRNMSGSMLDVCRASDMWQHFALCHSVFGKDPADIKDENELGRSSEEDREHSQTFSREDESKCASKSKHENGDQVGSSALVDAIRMLEKERAEQRAETQVEQEERNRRFLIEIEKLRLETRSYVDLQIEQLRQDQALKIKELELRVMYMIKSSSEPTPSPEMKSADAAKPPAPQQNTEVMSSS